MTKEDVLKRAEKNLNMLIETHLNEFIRNILEKLSFDQLLSLKNSINERIMEKLREDEKNDRSDISTN